MLLWSSKRLLIQLKCPKSKLRRLSDSWRWLVNFPRVLVLREIRMKNLVNALNYWYWNAFYKKVRSWSKSSMLGTLKDAVLAWSDHTQPRKENLWSSCWATLILPSTLKSGEIGPQKSTMESQLFWWLKTQLVQEMISMRSLELWNNMRRKPVLWLLVLSACQAPAHMILTRPFVISNLVNWRNSRC